MSTTGSSSGALNTAIGSGNMQRRQLVVLVGAHLDFMSATLARSYRLLRSWDEPNAALLAEAEVMVVSGERPLDFELAAAMPKLRYVACASRGYDAIDLDWLAASDIRFSHAQHVNDEDVADHALGCIISHRRALADADRLLKSGVWNCLSARPNRSLRSIRLGIVGLGSIGRALAERAAALRMSVGWWGPHPKAARWPRAAGLMELARSVDYLAITARAENNDGMISSKVLDALGPEGVLVNVARGRLVDEDALIAALKEGRLGGAALDVFVEEPTTASRWSDVPNTLLTPHIAGRTQDAFATIAEQVSANLAAFFQDASVPHSAVGPVLAEASR